jgi:hypothetical protein
LVIRFGGFRLERPDLSPAGAPLANMDMIVGSPRRDNRTRQRTPRLAGGMLRLTRPNEIGPPGRTGQSWSISRLPVSSKSRGIQPARPCPGGSSGQTVLEATMRCDSGPANSVRGLEAGPGIDSYPFLGNND